MELDKQTPYGHHIVMLTQSVHTKLSDQLKGIIVSPASLYVKA